MRKAGILAGIGLSIAFCACSSVPQSQIDEGKAALEKARNADATQWAQNAWQSASRKNDELEAELRDQREKWMSSYDRTAKLASELKELAETAKLQATQAKEEARKRTLTVIEEAESALTSLKSKASNVDEDYSDEMATCEAVIQRARSDLSSGSYQSGYDNASNAKSLARQIEMKVDTALQQQIAVTQYVNDQATREQQVSRAMDRLADLMRSAAESAADPRHPFSKIENTTQVRREITYQTPTRVEFTAHYECRMRGAITGGNKFEVGVKVNGLLENSGDGWSGRVVGKNVTYDNKIQ